ncbi:GntP family permease [Cellulomonas sp. APG4]|uniref:GntP family permease n=1 Tax=Cellulomonas sp. APG4 TaxID=1538656 RepID=UPI00137A398E|nr:GntP family permease [Cellulomonas sp. APG4]NCT92347.1 GntP family permease [Cellulomonas sp. APG4]
MPPEDWTQTLTAGPLLAIAAGAVGLLLFLIIVLRLHAFVSLILVSALTALVAGVPVGSVVDVLTGGFGQTLGSVALLVGLGAMLGRMVETSGGAQVMAETLIARFGERRAPLALGVASLIFGFPIFFDAGLVVMLPIVFAVARRLGGSVLLYGLPTAGAFSVMHIFVPPHPGPVAASELLGADPGMVIILGLVVAIPTWYVTSYLFGVWAGRRWVLPVPEILGAADDEDRPENPPSLATVMGILLLPLVLIFLNTGLDTLRAAGVVDGEATWFALLRMVGATPVALLIAVLVAAWVLGRRRGRSKTVIEKLLDSALGPVASVILITGAGGMFGGVLRASGIGDALADVLGDLGLPVIVAGFLVATILRIAQGSATVALITAAGLIQPAVEAAGLSAVQLAAVVLAVAAGSVMASHVNDSGFWLVGRFFGMDVRTTLKTWTVLETLIGLMGFALAYVVFLVA